MWKSNKNHWSKTDKRDQVLSKISVGWKNLDNRPFKKQGEDRKCLICGKTFYVKKAHIVRGWGKYCSVKCNGIAKKSIPEENHSSWRGDNVGYSGIHVWVKKHKGKPGPCEHCGKSGRNQWANVSREYKRDINDYISLCSSCHKKYDVAFAKNDVI